MTERKNKYPPPLVLRNGGIGYRFRRFGRRACLGTALLPVVPTYSRVSDDILVIIQYLGYNKAWFACILSVVRICWYQSRGEGGYLLT